MTSYSAKNFSRENLGSVKNGSDDSDEKFETQNLYDWESESVNLDFICRNCILLSVELLIIFNSNSYFFISII